MKGKPDRKQSIKSREVLSQLAKAFSRLDVNKNGSISKAEFISGLLKDKEVKDCDCQQSHLHTDLYNENTVKP